MLVERYVQIHSPFVSFIPDFYHYLLELYPVLFFLSSCIQGPFCCQVQRNYQQSLHLEHKNGW